MSSFSFIKPEEKKESRIKCIEDVLAHLEKNIYKHCLGTRTDSQSVIKILVTHSLSMELNIYSYI
jgi:hypothetical protein